MTADDIEALFTRSADGYVFARWARPIVPVVFGVDDATLATVKGAIEAVVTLAGHRMAETDPDQGANLAFKMNPETYDTTVTAGLVQPYTYSDMTGAGLGLVYNPPAG